MPIKECLQDDNWNLDSEGDSVCKEGSGEPPLTNSDFTSITNYIQCEPVFLRTADLNEKNSAGIIFVTQFFEVGLLLYFLA